MHSERGERRLARNCCEENAAVLPPPTSVRVTPDPGQGSGLRNQAGGRETGGTVFVCLFASYSSCQYDNTYLLL